MLVRVCCFMDRWDSVIWSRKSRWRNGFRCLTLISRRNTAQWFVVLTWCPLTAWVDYWTDLWGTVPRGHGFRGPWAWASFQKSVTWLKKDKHKPATKTCETTTQNNKIESLYYHCTKYNNILWNNCRNTTKTHKITAKGAELAKRDTKWPGLNQK